MIKKIVLLTSILFSSISFAVEIDENTLNKIRSELNSKDESEFIIDIYDLIDDKISKKIELNHYEEKIYKLLQVEDDNNDEEDINNITVNENFKMMSGIKLSDFFVKGRVYYISNEKIFFLGDNVINDYLTINSKRVSPNHITKVIDIIENKDKKEIVISLDNSMIITIKGFLLNDDIIDIREELEKIIN